MDAVRAFIEEEARRRRTTLAEVSRRLGKNHAYLQQFVRRGVPADLPEKVRRKLAEMWQIDEVKLGGPEARVVPAGMEFSPDPEFTDNPDGAEAAGRAERRELRAGEVVERDVTGGLGAGGIATQIVVGGKVLDNVRATWTLPVEYLRAELRAREADVDIIAVDGDSMQPTLVPGDRVMINRRQTVPSPDGLYAIHDGIGVVVKRLEVVHGAAPPRVRIKSDNPVHGFYEQPAEEVRVIGRVICKVTRM